MIKNFNLVSVGTILHTLFSGSSSTEMVLSSYFWPDNHCTNIWISILCVLTQSLQFPLLAPGKCLGGLLKVRWSERAQWGSSYDVTSQVDSPQSSWKTEAAIWIVVSDPTAPLACTCTEGIKPLYVLRILRHYDHLGFTVLPPCLFSQTLRDSDSLLRNDESCLALLSDAQSRHTQYSGLLTDARPATTQSYIYIHKTEENGEKRHTFCYCLEKDQWKELEIERGEETASMPDLPGSYLTSYAEKVQFRTGMELA